MSNPNPPAIALRAPRWFVALAVLLLAGYAIFLALNTSTVAGGADSSGYLNSARLLASGHRQADWRLPTPFLPVPSASRLHFSPHGFYPTADNPLLPPTYPSGLPLHYAAAGLLLGWTAGPLAVSLLAAVGTLCLCYLIARELALDRWLAVAGAVGLDEPTRRDEEHTAAHAGGLQTRQAADGRTGGTQRSGVNPQRPSILPPTATRRRAKVVRAHVNACSV